MNRFKFIPDTDQMDSGKWFFTTERYKNINGEKTVFSTNVIGTEYPCAKYIPQPKPHYLKINSKQIVDLTVKYKTIKPLEENMRGNLKDLGLVGALRHYNYSTVHKRKSWQIGLCQNVKVLQTIRSENKNTS